MLEKCLYDASVLPHGLARCPGADQRVLNSVFWGRWQEPPAKARFEKMNPHSEDDVNRTSYGKYDFVHFHGKPLSPAALHVYLEGLGHAPREVQDACRPVDPNRMFPFAPDG
mmetsp:Transcript_1697/g.5110  ORF Transcript_1697/g.5110 Transcript_1697/m.5110 type:complete len:112 (+) Transcript_1697:1-336(+)